MTTDVTSWRSFFYMCQKCENCFCRGNLPAETAKFPAEKSLCTNEKTTFAPGIFSTTAKRPYWNHSLFAHKKSPRRGGLMFRVTRGRGLSESTPSGRRCTLRRRQWLYRETTRYSSPFPSLPFYKICRETIRLELRSIPLICSRLASALGKRPLR